ncbi:MAG TPA: DUF4861 family protein [Steroidobacteraceae bacterium]|nr:DUF4861 family protein [Steroidobacteraceae bacterium]
MSTLAAVLILSNPLPFARSGEVVEIPMSEVLAHTRWSNPRSGPKGFLVREQATGAPVMSQIYDGEARRTSDRLLLLVDLEAHATVTLDVYSDEAPNRPPSKVFARSVPERMDDFAWENDKVAYRVYGPALEATGEIGSGIDVWSKRVPDFVINGWYQRDLEGQRRHDAAMSYHVDNGQGLDSYKVGTSRGCGGTAVWDDGKLIASNNVTTSQILADGPIRVAFELRYAPWKAAGLKVDEIKVVELDAGSHMNHWYSQFHAATTDKITVALGLAIHDPAQVEQLGQGSIISVWDSPQLANAGHIATGLVLPPATSGKFARLPENAVLLLPTEAGEIFDYYAGAGWSQADMPTAAAWKAYLMEYLERLRHPVTYKWKAKN